MTLNHTRFASEYLYPALNTTNGLKTFSGVHLQEFRPEFTFKGKRLRIEYSKKQKCFKIYPVNNIVHNIHDILPCDGIAGYHKIVKISFLDRLLNLSKLFKKSHILVDARTLDEIIDKKDITYNYHRNNDSKNNNFREGLKNLAQYEEIEAEEIKKTFEDKLSEPGRRIWKTDNDEYKTHLEEDRGTFIQTTKQDPDTIIEILNGKALLRRGHPLMVPIIPVTRRKFRSATPAKMPPLIIDGADDTASALTSSGISDTLASVMQITIFSLFLLGVRIGIQNLSDESIENKEELEGLKAAMEDSQGKIKDFRRKLSKKESVTQEDIEGVIESINTLKSVTKEIDATRLELIFSTTGYIAMLAMQSAVISYNAVAISTLFTSGVSNIVGDLCVFSGQVLMTVSASGKAYIAFQNAQQIKEVISEIKGSDFTSDLTKRIILAMKKDERTYEQLSCAGNVMLAGGQATMAISGPMALALMPGVFAGLGLTAVGVGLNTGVALRQQKVYSYDDTEDEVTKIIKAHYTTELCECILAYLSPGLSSKSNVDNDVDDPLTKKEDSGILDFQGRIKRLPYIDESEFNELEKLDLKKEEIANITHSTSYTLEALSHLNAVPLAINKILKESSIVFGKNKNKDSQNTSYQDTLDIGIKASKQHYEPRKHQAELLRIVEKTDNGNLELLKESINNAVEGGDELHYMFIWQTYVDVLRVKPQDAGYIIPLGELLYEYNQDMADKTYILQKIKSIKALPDKIKEKINPKKVPSYNKLIMDIQNGYISHKTSNLKAKLEEYNALKKEDRPQKLSESMLASPYGEDFKARNMQQIYKSGNNPIYNHDVKLLHIKSAKESGEYNKDGKSPLKIIGQVKKSGGGNWFPQIPHIKNAYTLDVNALNTKGVPDRVFRKILVKDSKSGIRSTYYRGLFDLGGIHKAYKAVEKVLSFSDKSRTP